MQRHSDSPSRRAEGLCPSGQSHYFSRDYASKGRHSREFLLNATEKHSFSARRSPIDESECTFLTLDSKTPYLSEYPGTDAGKMAHYLLRWRMQDGSVSAFGETISATITG